MRLLGVSLAFASLACGQPLRVEGRVVGEDGAPIPRVAVYLNTSPSRNPFEKDHPPVAVDLTDAQGRFGFSAGLATYWIHVNKPGYEPLNRGSGPEAGAFQVTLDKRQIEIRMQKLGVIAGVVLGADNQPKQHVPLALISGDPAPPGTLGGLSSGLSGEFRTNDRGEFRFTNLPHGRYYVEALLDPDSPSDRSSSSLPTRSAAFQFHLPTYYPRALTLAEAVPIDVASTPVEGLRLQMRRGPRYSIRGTVTGMPTSGDGFVSSDLILYPRQLALQYDRVYIQNGSFKIDDLAPGDYTIVVRASQGRDRLHDPGDDFSNTVNGRVEVHIADSNVEGVVIPLKPAKFSAVCSYESRDRTRYHECRLELTGLLIGQLSAMVPLTMGQKSEIRSMEVRPDVYTPALKLDPGSYVQKVLLNGRDVTGDAVLDFRKGDPAHMEFFESPRAGKIKLETTGDRMVSVWPAQLHMPHLLSGFPMLIPAGRDAVELADVPPGEYYALEWEVPPVKGIVAQAAFLKQFENRAAKVTVAEGMDVHMTPALIRRGDIESAMKSGTK